MHSLQAVKLVADVLCRIRSFSLKEGWNMEFRRCMHLILYIGHVFYGTPGGSLPLNLASYQLA